MNIDEIVNQIKYYLEREKTNYAYLISGAWGSGKTYLLKNVLIPQIKDIELNIPEDKKITRYRPIYISLSGINNLSRLKELMFARINTQVRSPRMYLDDEIDLLKNVTNEADLNSRPDIPLNIVFCFDDLERIEPDFLEEALGFINFYIEHDKVKALFLCDENNNNESIQAKYQKIKEKYIRFSIEITPNFEDLLTNNVNNSLNENELQFIKQILEKAKCENMRTLEFLLSVLHIIFDQFENNKKELNIEEKYVSTIKRLLIFYSTFFSIELKKGIPYDILINIWPPRRILTLSELGLEVDFGDTGENSTKKDDALYLQKEKILNQINKFYFDENNEPFEPFNSIAKYMKTGFFDNQKFKAELNIILSSLRRREGTEEEKVLKKTQDIFMISDNELISEIDAIIEAVKKGQFSLGSYLQIYSQLLVLESYGISGININNQMRDLFILAMNKSLESGKLEFDPVLYEKYGSIWSHDKESEQANKYLFLLNEAENLNNQIKIPNNINITLENIINLIRKGSYDKLYDTLVTNRWNYQFAENDADEIFRVLKSLRADNINAFRSSLKERYSLHNDRTPASNEYLFIKK